jgi:protein-S-isoprenylcysteine O-methyltransferase Ste14
MRPATAGKLAYGALFVLLLPVALAAWAHSTAVVVSAPAVHSDALGMGLTLLGLALISAGMLSLWMTGGGLPMNAFPPPRFVTSGIYRVVPHPIYTGAVIASAGISIWTGSAAGLWLITPALALASAALVLGYELPDLKRRFGAEAGRPVICSSELSAPPGWERLRFMVLVLLPWLALYEAILALGTPSDAVSTFLPFEKKLPVWTWTESIYASTYVVTILAPWLVRSRQRLRRLATGAWVSMAVIFPVYLVFPLIAEPRPMTGSGIWADLLLLERRFDAATAAFPSYHVVWAGLVAVALADNRGIRRAVAYAWAAAVAISCVTTGMHSVLDVVAGVAMFLIVDHAEAIWRWLRMRCEQIANSWREWRIGPLRVINHGAYGAAAILLWIVIMDTLFGPGRDGLTVTIFACGAVGAALWAQIVEGSPSLLRPMGFYGGMLGTIAGAFFAPLFGVSVWTALCVICVGAPWLQAIGRVRCLVQGCCHGKVTAAELGIRYFHPRSRVTRLAGMAGIPVHATQLYSILWNALIALVMFRLLATSVPATFVCGVYLILSGSGRFVEEAYRGEPQTAVFGGLRLYQWIAIVSVVSGAFITTIVNAPVVPKPQFHATSMVIGLVCALAGWFLSGMDFPESNRRFARLT